MADENMEVVFKCVFGFVLDCYSRDSSSSIFTRVCERRLNTFLTFRRSRAVSVNLGNLVIRVVECGGCGGGRGFIVCFSGGGKIILTRLIL